jgi:hypothetical protein
MSSTIQASTLEELVKGEQSSGSGTATLAPPTFPASIERAENIKLGRGE